MGSTFEHQRISYVPGNGSRMKSNSRQESRLPALWPATISRATSDAGAQSQTVALKRGFLARNASA